MTTCQARFNRHDVMTFQPALIPRLFAFPLLAFAGQWYWIRNYDPLDPWGCVIWIPLLTYCWFCVGGLSHEIIHHNLPISARLNWAIGSLIGTVLGIPYSVYREVHMRHHAYLNTPLDWELWPYSDPAASLRFRRVFVWLDLGLGLLAYPLIWGRICFSKRSPVKDQIKRTMRREYLAVAGFWLTVAGFCIWLQTTQRFLFQPKHAIFVLPLFLAGNVNSLRKMVEHLGTASFDPLLGTRTIVGSNLLTNAFSYFDFDLAVHGPHHRHPKLEHSRLKNKMSELCLQNPGHAYPLFSTFADAVKDTLRTLFLNPAVGVNAGCTTDISHLPEMQGFAPVVPETPPVTHAK